MEGFEEPISASELASWAKALEEIERRIGPRFSRIETRQRALGYIRGLLSPAERKNGWQLAEALGEETPYGIQHLLGRADWEADLLRDDLHSYVAERLGDPEGVLVLDETGFLKKGRHSAGVARQYSGTAGKVENCQIGVFLAYASRWGETLLDRELYLPKEWIEDPERREETAVPEDRTLLTKPKLGKKMLERAFESAIPFRWVVADCVYGDDRRLRLWIEERKRSYVMAVSGKEYVAVGLEQVRVSTILEHLPDEGWARRSCGEGSKGERLYDWLLFPINPPVQEGFSRWMLVRRSLSGPTDLQAFAVFAPEETSLEEIVGVAGRRWAIEACFESAKGEVGLDHYEVRSFHGWYRHVTLSMWAHALLSSIRGEGKRGMEVQPQKRGSLGAFRAKRGLSSG